MNEALRRGGNAEQGNSSVGFDQLDFHRNIAIDPPLVLASDLDKLRFSSSLPPLDLNHFSFFLLFLAASLNIVFHFPSLSLLPDGRISNLAPSRRGKKWRTGGHHSFDDPYAIQPSVFLCNNNNNNNSIKGRIADRPACLFLSFVVITDGPDREVPPPPPPTNIYNNTGDLK